MGALRVIHCRNFGPYEDEGRTMTGTADDYVTELTDELSLRDVPPEAAERIVEARASLRERHGWIMDIYLLRRVVPIDELRLR